MGKFISYCLGISAENRMEEFKRVGGEKSKVVRKTLESIVAMSNTDGGLIILGIDDPEKGAKNLDERIFGIEENLERFDEIRKEITNISPPISGLWDTIIIEKYDSNRRVAGLIIPKARETFHTWKDKVFVRLEKGNKALTPSEIVKFSYIKGFNKADRELVNIDFELLETENYKEWKNTRSIKGNQLESILYQTGLARKQANKLMPTRASVLLFANYPNDILEEKTSIKVTQYTGALERIKETPNIVGVPKIINGPLIQQIKDAHDYVLTLLRAGVKIPSGFTTKYQIPERAVKEAITNAVIHRDYYTKRDIEIRLFEDRIEVESPGLLPSNITQYNIGFERAENYRNDLLVKHLREFPSPPNLDQNEGVRAMRAEMKSKNLYPPFYWTYPNKKDSVVVILFNEYLATEWEKVSSYLEKQNGVLTNVLTREITGITDRSAISRLLKKWVMKGLLIKIEPKNGGYKGIKYVLNIPNKPNFHQ
ncbi:MAG: ATP-binding protein [Candidatus Marinimicrobia bacterium]|nr:ATP-binding protein [Candidatus Neomarinimicrobiota bacterium]